ncbi:putative F-box protein At3g17265 [Silene latifolia]|uniref:putative F-box protein At3g17265 n=1 Tax=Silene latifolia TaxID=37657 RepID=UPI003D76D016
MAKKKKNKPVMSATMKTTTTMADAIEKLPPYLPTEVIFNILINVPVQALLDAKHVCKQWYDIVSDPLFVKAHCQKSSLGFLIQDSNNYSHVNYIDVNMPIEKTKTTKVENPSEATILCSLNGLALLSDPINEEIFHVVNPMTKEKISLPPLKVYWRSPKSAGLAVNSSGHYKVVHVSVDNYGYSYLEQLQIRIFTIGVDKAWRLIDLQGIPNSSTMYQHILIHPYCCRRYIYWFHYYSSFDLALDVDTETIYQFTGPKNEVNDSRVEVVSMETSIGVIDETSTLLNVWKLTDVKSNKWTEFARINVEPVYKRFSKLFGRRFKDGIYPVGLFDGDFWFYCWVGNSKYVVVRKNLADKRFEFFEIERGTLHPHASTYVSPEKLIDNDRALPG